MRKGLEDMKSEDQEDNGLKSSKGEEVRVLRDQEIAEETKSVIVEVIEINGDEIEVVVEVLIVLDTEEADPHLVVEAPLRAGAEAGTGAEEENEDGVKDRRTRERKDTTAITIEIGESEVTKVRLENDEIKINKPPYFAFRARIKIIAS